MGRPVVAVLAVALVLTCGWTLSIWNGMAVTGS